MSGYTELPGASVDDAVAHTAMAHALSQVERTSSVRVMANVHVHAAYLERETRPGSIFPSPVLRLVGQVTSLSGNLPEGIGKLTLNSPDADDHSLTQGMDFVARYAFTPRQKAVLVSKGLLEPGFKVPELVAHNDYEFPVTANFTYVRTPACAYPFVFAEIPDALCHETSLADSRYDLASYFDISETMMATLDKSAEQPQPVSERTTSRYDEIVADMIFDDAEHATKPELEHAEVDTEPITHETLSHEYASEQSAGIGERGRDNMSIDAVFDGVIAADDALAARYGLASRPQDDETSAPMPVASVSRTSAHAKEQAPEQATEQAPEQDAPDISADLELLLSTDSDNDDERERRRKQQSRAKQTAVQTEITEAIEERHEEAGMSF